MSSPESYLRSIERSVDSGHGLAAECYRDPACFELETERVLRPGWHPLARWDELPEPGDYRTLDLCGEPLVIVRDQARDLRVYSNVCRHRAHIVIEGSGNTERFVCPYHRWTYGLDGQLVGAPLTNEIEGFDRTTCGLRELRTESWMGFVLATLNPAAESLAAQLKPLEEKLAPHGFAEMVTMGVLEFDSPWNWKVMVDNFMESYHHLGPHTETLQKSNLAKDTYPVDIDGPCALLENPGFNGAPDFYVAQVFPTTLLALFRNGSGFGSWYEMEIDRHDHINLRIVILGDREFAKTPGIEESMRDATMKVHLEDIPVCEGVQRGISSRLYESGPLTHYEGCLTRFHSYLADQLRGR